MPLFNPVLAFEFRATCDCRGVEYVGGGSGLPTGFILAIGCMRGLFPACSGLCVESDTSRSSRRSSRYPFPVRVAHAAGPACRDRCLLRIWIWRVELLWFGKRGSLFRTSSDYRFGEGRHVAAEASLHSERVRIQVGGRE